MMDGLPENLLLEGPAGSGFASSGMISQRSLKQAIGCVGIGLHSGQRISLTLLPAPADSGIVFRRTDLGIEIPARFDHVTETRLSTMIGLSGFADARVGTIEHLMAAFAGCGIDNAVVELRPSDRALGLDLSMSIAFDAPAIGRQALSMSLSPASFRRELARARTFTEAAEVAGLQAAGLALGGNLDNAVVVDGDRVLNPGGLRMKDEFVRHKMLDAIGDLALAGAELCGRLIAHRSGHRLNNLLLRALFADSAAWRLVTQEGANAWRSAA
jgi:UDP-3-O-[3-hydroxymyristoyl] N-acetylglucosamine deacetylase